MTDDLGSILEARDYLPYGQEISTSSSHNAMHFTGHERDSHQEGELDNMDYMHARYFSPHLRRFMSPDLLGGDPILPQSWNRYAYVLNNPIKHVDPTGLAIECVNRAGDDEEENIVCVESEPVEVIGEAPRADETSGVAVVGFSLDDSDSDADFPDPLELTMTEFAMSSLPFNGGIEFANCVRENRADPALALSALGSAVPKRLVPPFRVPNPSQPLTTPASAVAFQVGQRFRNSPGAARFASGLRVGGRVVSRVATPLTIAEGFFDIGVLAACGFGG